MARAASGSWTDGCIPRVEDEEGAGESAGQQTYYNDFFGLDAAASWRGSSPGAIAPLIREGGEEVGGAAGGMMAGDGDPSLRTRSIDWIEPDSCVDVGAYPMHNVMSSASFAYPLQVDGLSEVLPGRHDKHARARPNTIFMRLKTGESAAALVFEKHISITGVRSVLAGVKARATAVAMIARYTGVCVRTFDFTPCNYTFGACAGHPVDLVQLTTRERIHNQGFIRMASFRLTDPSHATWRANVNVFPSSGNLILMGIRSIAHAARVIPVALSVVRRYPTPQEDKQPLLLHPDGEGGSQTKKDKEDSSPSSLLGEARTDNERVFIIQHAHLKPGRKRQRWASSGRDTETGKRNQRRRTAASEE